MILISQFDQIKRIKRQLYKITFTNEKTNINFVSEY